MDLRFFSSSQRYTKCHYRTKKNNPSDINHLIVRGKSFQQDVACSLSLFEVECHLSIAVKQFFVEYDGHVLS